MTDITEVRKQMKCDDAKVREILERMGFRLIVDGERWYATYSL